MAYNISQEDISIIEGVLLKELMSLGRPITIFIDQADIEGSGNIQGWHM
jgi:hypothetical protein